MVPIEAAGARALVVALCLAAALVLSACGAPANEAAVADRPVLSVEAVTPAQENWPARLRASGEVAPWQEAIIGTEVAGVRLAEVLVDTGAVVARGQLLARYEDDSLRAELSRLEAEVAERQATLAQAQADVARIEALRQTQAIAEQVAQGHRTQAAVAQARLDSARAQRQAQALRLQHARVTAPDDGVITARTATLGAVGTLGGELFRLLRGGRLEWRAEVPAASLALLRPGIAVELQRGDGSRVTGTLRQVAPLVDAHTRNGIVHVDLPADSGLSGGMYLSGDFVLEARSALVVPESAIVMRDGYSYVMRIGAGDIVQAVKVVTGRRQGEAIEIVEGVAPGERVVKSGGAFLGDGARVAVIAP